MYVHLKAETRLTFQVLPLAQCTECSNELGAAGQIATVGNETTRIPNVIAKSLRAEPIRAL